MASVDDRIFEYIRARLTLDIPLLEGVLNILEPVAGQRGDTFATEGTHLYYESSRLADQFSKNPVFLNRLFLHSILHCMYLQPFTEAEKDYYFQMGDGFVSLRDLCCDISIEYIIDRLLIPSVKRPLSFLRTGLYSRMEAAGATSPWQIYKLLTGAKAFEPAGQEPGPDLLMGHAYPDLLREFYTDSHILWPVPNEENRKGPSVARARKNWEEAARTFDIKKLKNRLEDQDSSKDTQVRAEDVLTAPLESMGDRVSYRDILRSLLRVNEKSGISPDEFDTAMYSYGLSCYGNIPLMEPVETYEDETLKELVIVIDTSYSTSGELVKSFLQETKLIIAQEGLWANGGRIRLIQCDDSVRSDELLGTETDVEAAISSYTLLGGGGTDFRPAFEYINDQIAGSRAEPPDGLLYFTDGKGIYPKEAPPYPVAFLFKGSYDKNRVPPWALSAKV